ncbi:MAG: 16S rRNA (cytosine(967)-C(5))-methyltransferase RsmB [SAR324 cluster bacterium]|uniref:16S rRNA (cytosine(967)-C(5))-methyltransferase n=1 Tax=SAR324 cluster bacterium TaxID=2024889 RepID=A0A7X9IM65_9DELT|nr:16S rRNA (cytosine(967)-C(5))-methyltransferase RsmB [SAR324 cluster bacterium]
MQSQSRLRNPGSIREHALQILYRVDTTNAYAHILLKKSYEALGNEGTQSSLLTRLVKGTLENRSVLDEQITRLSKSRIRKLGPWIRNILRLGAYQVMYLDNIPKEVSVNECVELTKIYGHSGQVAFVNAVLRNLCRSLPFREQLSSSSIEDLAISTSHPTWIVELWSKQLGVEETKLLCNANNDVWPTFFRVNTLKTTTDSLIKRLGTEGLTVEKGRFSDVSLKICQRETKQPLNELSSFKEGLFTIQDESETLISLFLDPKPGHFVLDLCSAPGNKTVHIAELMKNKGLVIALDPHPRRLKLVKSLCIRLGVSIVESIAADGLHTCCRNFADRILVDAPCSGLGILGNKVDLRWNEARKDFLKLTQLQEALLENASSLLVLGGRLVYSTCTINRHENTDIIENFLSRHKEFHLVPVPLIELANDKGYYEVFPHRHGMAGAFAAILEKKKG